MSQIENIKEWARNNCSAIDKEYVINNPDPEVESYWSNYCSDIDINDYDFNNLLELRSMLEDGLSDIDDSEAIHQLIDILLKDAFAEECKLAKEKYDSKSKGNIFNIVDYIYMF